MFMNLFFIKGPLQLEKHEKRMKENERERERENE